MKATVMGHSNATCDEANNCGRSWCHQVHAYTVVGLNRGGMVGAWAHDHAELICDGHHVIPDILPAMGYEIYSLLTVRRS